VAGETEETTLKLIADSMRSYSQILKAVAEIEEASREPFDEVLKKLFSPEKLAEMRNRLPPDLYAEFAAPLFKLASVAPKLQNPLALTTEEKKKFKRNAGNSRNRGKDSHVEAMRAQLPPPIAPPVPQLRAAVTTAFNATATLTADLQAVRALIGATPS